MHLIVPAVLPSSREDFDEKLELLTHIPSVSRIQIDVVDSHFATPISWPYSAPRELQNRVERGEMLPFLNRLSYEIDLMCVDAEQAADAWLALGATRLTFHAEGISNLSNFFASMRRRYGSGDGFAPGLISFGLAVNVANDLVLVESCLSEIEYVQFMGIAHIGKQGQSFDRRTLERVRTFHSLHPEFPIQVDGGVSLDNAQQLIASGVSDLIVGSAILRATNPSATFLAFKELQRGRV